MTRTVAATAWYAYAVVGPVDEAVRAAASELEVIGTDEVAVVAVEVPLSEYGEDVLPSRLNDRDWLERTARRHEAIVERLAAVTTVLPLRFGSLHRDRATVEAFLAENGDELRATLERVRGRVEVGVKVWLAAAAATPASEHRVAASGRDYLERRREAKARAAEASASLDERLLRLHERLLAVAEEGVTNRPQARELSGSHREMVLNGAYLVDAGDESLYAELEQLRSENPDLVLEVTGPWAPYNFVDTERAA